MFSLLLLLLLYFFSLGWCFTCTLTIRTNVYLAQSCVFVNDCTRIMNLLTTVGTVFDPAVTAMKPKLGVLTTMDTRTSQRHVTVPFLLFYVQKKNSQWTMA
jgi:hypothetical protein